MLSRHAEDLYWTGRYVERAEDTARMLDVTYHGLLESPPAEEASAWKELLAVLYLDHGYPDDMLSAERVTNFLVLDPSNQGSILASVARARDNARGVRDRISTELWEALNTFHLELQTRGLAADLESQPYSVYRMVRNRCQMVCGVAAETMPRDDGFRFFTLGRMLERAEMGCRLLAVRYARLSADQAGPSFHHWVTVLKSVSAFEAYLKEYRAAMDPIDVLEFLLLSPDFPRSVLYCLRATESHLSRLVPAEQSTTAQRLLGRTRSQLEYLDVEEILSDGLTAFLDTLQGEIWRVGEAIDSYFFRAGTDLEIHAYEAT